MNNNTVYGGFWTRFIAMGIDGGLFFLPSCFFLLWVNQTKNLAVFAYLFFLFLILIALPTLILNNIIDAVLTYKFGGTVGKLITGLRVVDEQGKFLTLKRSFFRYTIGYQFSGLLFGLGFFAVIKDVKKQGWHDKATGSYVIQKTNNMVLGLLVAAILVCICLYVLTTAFTAFRKGPLLPEMGNILFLVQQESKIKEKQKEKPSSLYQQEPQLPKESY